MTDHHDYDSVPDDLARSGLGPAQIEKLLEIQEGAVTWGRMWAGRGWAQFEEVKVAPLPEGWTEERMLATLRTDAAKGLPCSLQIARIAKKCGLVLAEEALKATKGEGYAPNETEAEWTEALSEIAAEACELRLVELLEASA